METLNGKHSSVVQQSEQKSTPSFGKRITIKAIIIVGLMLMMLVPVALVYELVENRQRSSQEISQEITDRWGGELMLGTPFILNSVINETGQYEPTHALSADQFTVISDVDVQQLHRGIYKTQVFKTKMTIRFNFLTEVLKSLVNLNPPQWQSVYVFIPITNNTFQGAVTATLNGKDLDVTSHYYHYRPSLNAMILGNGIRAKVSVEELLSAEPLGFELSFAMTGSRELEFSSVAKNTTVKVSSAWDSPSFYGESLPMERQVTKDGFTAEWNLSDISALNGAFPKSFGVKLVNPLDHYQQVERSIKYAYMFIALTFLAFFLVEITYKTRIHPIQYFLVSVALIVFYALLLSLSEHISFSASYFVSMVATVCLITWYTHSILRKTSLTWAMCGWFVILYLFLFMMLRMEDYALLAGSVGLFAALAATMYILRNVKWYDK